MNNRDIYKDEFGQYHEVEEESEDSIDGLEDDDLEGFDDESDLFDSAEGDDDNDEDEDYANETHNEFDIDED